MKSFFILLLILPIGGGTTLSIQSADGDVIECVPIRDQPAFKHPLLKNHKVQYPPAELKELLNSREKNLVPQVWTLNGTSCPEETVPIRRGTHNTSKPRHVKNHFPDARRHGRSIPYAADQGHEYAIAYPKVQTQTFGTQATISIWDPIVAPGTDEFSLAQVWLVAGNYDGSDLNSIEAGWIVYPNHFLDTQPRLFVYGTKDTYQFTGCFNLECPGFVQVPSNYAIGMAFSSISSYGGNQFEVAILIWKDTKTGNWWLCIGQSVVGYWPSNLFTHLANGPATVVQWGGEIINSKSNGHHTTTQMGSGHFAEEGFRIASYFRNMMIIDLQHNSVPVQDFRLQTLNATCYTARLFNSLDGMFFYFGGPGFNALCP